VVDRNRGVALGYCDFRFERRKGSEASFLVVMSLIRFFDLRIFVLILGKVRGCRDAGKFGLRWGMVLDRIGELAFEGADGCSS